MSGQADRVNVQKNYGFFDDAKREYVITEPSTPFPWINYLGNDGFFGLISNTCGGYSFYRDARYRRLTRYRYNNVPTDTGGRYYYLRNQDGTVWNPGWKPSQTPLDHYECRHGLGYTQWQSEKDGIHAQLECLIPLGETAEIHRLSLSNRTRKPQTVSCFSLVEWCLWNAEDDAANFQRNLSTGEVEIHKQLLIHRTEYKERRNHYAFNSVNTNTKGFDTDRESFLGRDRSFAKPIRVEQNRAGNSHAHGWSPIASHHIEKSLAADETISIIFVTGYIETDNDEKFGDPLSDGRIGVNLNPAKALIARFETDEQFNKAKADLASYWQSRLSKTTIESDQPELDRMVNIWNPYQCMVTFNMSRSASYFESGIGRGMGFRDSSQDLLGCLHMIPERARERILDIAATQFEDGSAYHQYQPLSKRGNDAIGSNFNDDPLWLILSTSQYLKETGDYSILDVDVPFDNQNDNSASLLEHLHRSFVHTTERLGPHGLPLIGRADWNDCLNLNCFSQEPNESFQTTENQSGGSAESVFIAAQFILYGEELVDLCIASKNTERIEWYRQQIGAMRLAVETHAWDGAWYLRAFDFYGKKIGSDDCTEGKIFIESQGFGAMAGIGQDIGLPKKALDSVEQHLATPFGIVLQQPAYSRYYPEYGEISTYPAGYKENAGIFCHNNPWVMIAETQSGDLERAYGYYKAICPAYLQTIQELHRVEPYVYCQMIAGKDAALPGEGKNSWLTGTAAWNYAAIMFYIIGVRPSYRGLLIAPRLPAEIKGLCVNREFRGRRYRIEIRNGGSSTLAQEVRFDVKVNGEDVAQSISDYVIDLDAIPAKELHDNVIRVSVDVL